ncbi:GTPase domain-containing protein [Gordonia bronchialis]|uniref:GTPase domain-containing protein n=1 Tax=Gordonia bronchialis TaxID=2054 RepID=UPI001CBB1C58|nr:GTPase domain-containing protein [Gordonia bronchialis]UAK39175.1 GTPase domain-containing protein [Gordonia bronchialis]
MTITDKIRTWLASVSDDDQKHEFEAELSSFERSSKPVVTVLGSYDTGKSSLIRRILIDHGLEVPEWLTISARHETFAVNQVDCGAYLLRDTPGLAIGAHDARATANTANALDAITATDIAVITMTPQLATGELDTLRDLISIGWAPGTLWFVIGRFDEAGIAPESDPEHYRLLTEQKTADLRAMLSLDSEIPVFVVSQDFEQIGGPDRDLERVTWDESRDWDGMDRLESALTQSAQSRAADLRAKAIDRFWTVTAQSVVGGLTREREELIKVASAAQRATQQLELWDNQITTVNRAAQVALEAEINKESQHLELLQPDLASVTTAFTQVLDQWHRQQTRSLDRLLQDVTVAQTTERTNPNWQDLATILSQATVTNGPSSEGSDPIFTDTVKRVGPVVVGALTDYAKLSERRTKKTTTSTSSSAPSSMWSAGNIATAATVALPILVEVAKLADDQRSKVASQKQTKTAYTQQLTQYAQLTKSKALEEWANTVSDAREVVNDAFAQEAGALPIIEQRLSQIEDATARARELTTVAR